MHGKREQGVGWLDAMASCTRWFGLVGDYRVVFSRILRLPSVHILMFFTGTKRDCGFFNCVLLTGWGNHSGC